MKKYFILIIISIMIGFLLSFFVINQYKDNKGLTVYKQGEEVTFFKYGEYETKEQMQNETINLENYIYKQDNNIYKVYIGLTNSKDNIDKITNYYDKYDLKLESFYIVDTNLINKINDLDNILKNTEDPTAIGEIISQGLKYYDKDMNNDYSN